MTTSQATADYALGYTDAEQERLIRQATLIAPHTERLFREAGIGARSSCARPWIGHGGRFDAGCRVGRCFGRGSRNRT